MPLILVLPPAHPLLDRLAIPSFTASTGHNIGRPGCSCRRGRGPSVPEETQTPRPCEWHRETEVEAGAKTFRQTEEEDEVVVVVMVVKEEMQGCRDAGDAGGAGENFAARLGGGLFQLGKAEGNYASRSHC